MNKNTIVGQFFYEAALEEADIRSVKKLSGDKVIMEAVLQDANTLNRNKRKYRKTAIQEAINSPFITEKLNTKSLLGEYNHPPAEASVSRRMQIDMTNVSHVIKEVYWDEANSNVLLGRVETAGTRVGKDLAGLILENGMQASFSMRGAGEFVRHKDFVEVTGPLKIITWDCVHFPSHQTAYMRRTLNEDATAFDIKVNDIAQYIGESCDRDGYLAEEMMFLGRDMIDYTIEEGKVVIHEKATGRVMAWHTMTENAQAEYMDAMMSLKF